MMGGVDLATLVAFYLSEKKMAITDDEFIQGLKGFEICGLPAGTIWRYLTMVLKNVVVRNF